MLFFQQAISRNTCLYSSRNLYGCCLKSAELRSLDDDTKSGKPWAYPVFLSCHEFLKALLSYKLTVLFCFGK